VIFDSGFAAVNRGAALARAAASTARARLEMALALAVRLLSVLAVVRAGSSSPSIEELLAHSQKIHDGLVKPVLSTAHQSKIEHFVVLLKENRPFDHIVGCMDLPGADSAATMTRNRTLQVDPSDPSKGSVNVTCGTANYVCEAGPPSSLWNQKFAAGDDVNVAKYPYSPQSDSNSYAQGANGNAIEMFSPDQLPIKTTLAKAFGVVTELSHRLINLSSALYI
jgi:phospholipase C